MSDQTPPPSVEQAAPSAPGPAPLPAPVPGARFWNKKRVVLAIVAVIALILAGCSCLAFFAWRYIAAESARMAPLRAFVDEGYPGYRIVDSTRSGLILQHKFYRSLRLDVRFVGPDSIGVWAGPPSEELTDGWSTVETFFRHAKTRPVDPRTNMNYDVDGFVGAYEPLRPGPNSVVSAVWLESTDADGIEKYVVLVARRNRSGSYVEDMWPDHRAYFTRDPRSGAWTGEPFEPVQIGNPND